MPHKVLFLCFKPSTAGLSQKVNIVTWLDFVCISPSSSLLYIYIYIFTSFLLFGRWAASSCAMDSLYDMDLISDTVPVILDNSKLWYRVLLTSMKLGARGFAHVEGVTRFDLKENSQYSNLLLINRTASPLSW